VINPGRVEVERFKNILIQHLGLQFEEGKTDFLSDVLRQRAAESAAGSIDDYLARLGSPLENKQELRALAGCLTVSETYFFRNNDHFRAFREIILPRAIRGGSRQLRILSAGCASGEEAHTIAILLEQTLPDLAAWDLEITGIDINPLILKRAKSARYSTWALRETDSEIRQRYFIPDGRDFVLKASIRKMVRFEERNLAAEDPSFWRPEAFDVIFCRNVTMYFHPQVTRAVIARFSRALKSDGHLFLGHAETLRGISQAFHLCHTHETFYYQRRDGSASQGGLPEDSAATETRVDVPIGILEPNTSWVEAIQKASERIANLSRDLAPAAAPASPTVVRCDLGPTLELMRQERFSDALKVVQEFSPEALLDPDTRLLHAILLTNAGRLTDAEALCRKMLLTDEMNAGAHYLMALCREHAGDRDSAAEHDGAAVYLDPGFAMARFHLGLLAKQAGALSAARRELGEALNLLGREEPARILLFGGGFSREGLVALCRTELQACGAPA